MRLSTFFCVPRCCLPAAAVSRSRPKRPLLKRRSHMHLASTLNCPDSLLGSVSIRTLSSHRQAKMSLDLHRFFSGAQEQRPGFLRKAQPWAVIAGGGALAAYGLSRRSVPGVVLGALGGYVIYRGTLATRERTLARPVHVYSRFNIQKPVEELFQFWRNFENLPRFMRHVESVKATGDRHSHWVARAPMGATVSWDAEITDERENEYIVWRSLPGAMVPNRGSIQFRPDSSHGGSIVEVAIDYTPPAGKLGAVFAKMFGREPEQQVRDDLRRFKQIMEAGEIPTTEGQPSGRRTPWVRMMQAATAENTTMAERSVPERSA